MSSFTAFMLFLVKLVFGSAIAMSLGRGLNMPKGANDLGNLGAAETVVFDGSISNVFSVTLTGNGTISFTNLKVGEIYSLLVTQGGAGGFVPTFLNAALPVSQRPFTPAPGVGAGTVLVFMCVLQSGTTFGLATVSVGATPQTGVLSLGDLTLECAATKSILMQEDGAEARALAFTDDNPVGFGAGPVLKSIDNSPVTLGVAATGSVIIQSADTRMLDSANTKQIEITAATLTLGNSAADTVNIKGVVGTGAGYIPAYNSKTQATVGAAGAAAALPAQPTGYLNVTIGGTERVIPFYAQA